MQTKSSKYYGENGVHRVPLWRIAGYALNNASTNMYLFLMNYVAYFLTGIVGAVVVTASSFSMGMRLWDAVTDPFIGFLVDKTNGKFGKNRPFMVIGNIILLISSFILFFVTPKLPENTVIRFGFFIVISAIYYLGYTFQCVVTKSAQSCVTNDPKQRPLFGIFDGIYNTILFTVFAIIASNLGQKYGSFTNAAVFHDLWAMIAPLSFICMCIAVFCIAPKDRQEFYGTGKPVKISFKDYWDVLKNNHAIQMLVISASTDKLAASTRTATVSIVMIGIVAGDYAINGALTGIITIPATILMMFGIGTLATRLGQKRAMAIGSWGGIVMNALLACLWLFGDPTTLHNGAHGINWGVFTICHVVGSIIMIGFTGITSSIVIPMTADCADYEVYRSGKYVPGLMGTLFSFVDKLISSLAPMIAGIMFAAIGFTQTLPDLNTPYSLSLKVVAIFLMYGIVIIGLICNLIAMKFYPLTKEKMEEIQDEIARIKTTV